MFVFVSSVLHELILAVVSYTTCITHVGFLVCVPAFVVITISDGCESFRTMFALIGLFSCVNAHVHK